MSEGMKYLAGKRPEAMKGLMTYHGKCVQALDRKTKLLIQVVTKVATGTERGLRQYAPLALKAGASKEELLDAVLMAYPAAGLTKVIDAVHVLLEMDLLPPIDEAAGDADELTEVDLGPVGDYPVGQLRSTWTARGPLLIYRVSDDQINVFSGRCPHARGDLTQGHCDGAILECTDHHWHFNLRTGDNIALGMEGLIRLETEQRDGRLIALLNDNV